MSNKLELSKKARYKVWLNQAKHDLGAAEVSLNSKYYEWSCYQSTQSVEKALKAVIVHGGFRPPMTHKLGVLVSMANHANKEFLKVKLEFRKIEAYTFISRYPFILPGDNLTPHEAIDYKDASQCLEMAKKLINQVEEVISGIKHVEDENKIPLEENQYTQAEIENKIAEIIEKLQNDTVMSVKKIILFGSYARGTASSKATTMDVLVVADTELPFIERLQHVRDLTHGSEPIIEPIVYTPEEFDLMVNDEGEGFLESAIEEGRVVWEKTK